MILFKEKKKKKKQKKKQVLNLDLLPRNIQYVELQNLLKPFYQISQRWLSIVRLKSLIHKANNSL